MKVMIGNYKVPYSAARKLARIANKIDSRSSVNNKTLLMNSLELSYGSCSGAEEILSRIVVNNSLERIAKLKGISVPELTELKELYLSNLELSDIAGLKELKNLKRLSLSNTKVSDISPLAELKNLEVLMLSNTLVTNISPLKELNNLRWLRLSNTRVNDISPLEELKHLQVLFLSNVPVSEAQTNQFIKAVPHCSIRLI